MGLSTADVDAMSLAQWIAVTDAWREAHASPDEKPEAPSAEEYRRIVGNRR